jgi:flagellar biosynthesis protein FlhA
MADTKKQKRKFGFSNSSNLFLALMVILILGIMILPLPTFLMDVLLVMNITGALVILFVSLYVTRPLEFSVFPGLLLIVTLFRLSLNVATTRLILGQGFAGEIIDSFGGFVVKGNYVVGTVIFLILVIINFVVITKGSTRIAEVSARFTLDAMPGKQMAIDADLNAGLIDDAQARERRENISRESDFYGSMDGASKFVRGDAIAGLLITSVNILGGLAIGTLQRHMLIGDAASTYMLLTIGDGLVSQIPALIISTAAGIIISRASSKSSFGIEIVHQVSNQPRAIWVTAGVLAFMGFIPGLPFFPFFGIGAIVWFLGSSSYKYQRKLLSEQSKIPAEKEEIVEDKIESYLHPDPFEIEIGYGLIPLVDSKQGGNLLDRITTIRKSIAIEFGIVVPPIRIRDNIQLKSNEYLFKIYGIIAARGTVRPDQYMVINPDDRIDLNGNVTTEPTFNLPAIWITKKDKEKAEVAGYSVIEPAAVVATHLIETIKTNAHKLLDRQETKRMLDLLKETHPAVVEGLVPDIVSLGTINQVLKNLLAEKIPIRNLVLILETIADFSIFSKDPDVLTEYVRAALAETITDSFKQNNDVINCATLEPRVEDKVIEAAKNGNGKSKSLGFSPKQLNSFVESIHTNIEKMMSNGYPPVLLTSPQIRRVVRNFLEPVLPNLAVLSYSELTPDTNIKSVGTVRYPNEA